MSCFIIAEVGVNHNGDTQMAKELIDVAADCGADAVKFQTFSAEKLVRPEAEKAAYQKEATGDGNQFSMLRALEISHEDHRVLAAHCAARGVEFMSTPFDEDAADFLVEVGVSRLKVPSGDIDNFPLLRHLARKGLPLIVSTGMSSLDEVVAARDCIVAEWSQMDLPEDIGRRLVVLHCTSNYPTAPTDVNLEAMPTMARALGCPVGYSDHTRGSAVAVAAVAMGAAVIEKHITLDKALPGPDHAASLDPKEFAFMVNQIREVEVALGDGIKEPKPSELPVRALVRRSISIARDVPQGAVVTREDLVMLRPSNGISPSSIDRVVGRVAARDLGAGRLLDWSDLQ
jgi:N,N'-diacetyllegionaminate synthase